MAKLYDTSDPETLAAVIQDFLSASRRPAALDCGEEAVALVPGEYALECRAGRLWIEFWCGTRSIARRILAIERKSPGALQCAVQRFGGKTGTLSFLDLDRPQTAHKMLAGTRRSFAERFRQMLSRQFPGWEIATLSTSMDLRRSFSPVFPRAHLVRGTQRIAAVACPATRDEPRLLTFALIWFAYVAASGGAGSRTSLALFLPEHAGALTAHRLRWLRESLLGASLFRFNDYGSAGQVDPHDLGNLETRVSPHVTVDGSREQRERSPGNWQTHEQNDRFPERWLEHLVRANINLIDASLLPQPIHTQVLTFAGGDRDLIDLLATDASGRLTVLELKASEDVHLPMQALDYWMRVRWHAEREELRHLFPGLGLNRKPPRLLLVAPAISFHSSNATVLAFFSPEIEVERVGVNSEWQERFKVVLRLRGAERPQSHERTI